MSKPSDARPAHQQKTRGMRVAALTGLALAAATGLLLQMPLGATAGVAAVGASSASSATAATADDPVVSLAPLPPAPSSAGAAANRKSSGTYQLRCWQYGRLLFDEGPVTLGAEARQGAKMVALDRNGSPLMITADIGGTTCLARPSAPERSLALPR